MHQNTHNNVKDGEPQIDLERHAEDAALRAGKSLEDWLHDIILEQGTQDQAPPPATPRSTSDDLTKHAILNDLADRVKALESSYEPQKNHMPAGPLAGAVNSAAHQINRNYDEDARILIEGIRARAQKPAPTHQPVTHTPSPQDVTADRLAAMLDTISFLEDRLDDTKTLDNTKVPAPSSEPHTLANINRLAFLEEKLSSLDNQLTNNAPADDASKPQRRHTPDTTTQLQTPSRNHRKPAKDQGRRALRKTMETIAERQNGQGNDDAVYVPKNRSARSTLQRRDTDRYFKTLMEKIEEVKNSTPDIKALEGLKTEFSDLRHELTKNGADDNQTGNTHSEIKRLRNTLYKMQNSLASALDNDRLLSLEGDINRIAEFLLKSPDLSHLSNEVSGISNDLRHLSDGLLAVAEQAEHSNRVNGDLVFVRLEDSLNNLRNDIVAHIHNASTEENSGAALNDQLEHRLASLHNHFDQSMRDFSGQISAMGGQIHSATDQLETFGKIQADDTATGSQLEHRLTSLSDHLDGTMRDFSGQVSVMGNQLHSATERLEALGKARNGDPEMAVKFDQMENRLVKAAERLEQASLESARIQGDVPAALLTIPSDMITDEVLRTELDKLTQRLNVDLTEGQNNTLSRIDDAISTLQSLTDNQTATLEKISRHSVEQAVTMMGNQTARVQSVDDIMALRAYLDDMRATTDSFTNDTGASFQSLHDVLQDVSQRLQNLEETQQEGETAALHSSEINTDSLHEFRDYLAHLKSSSDNFSNEARSSFTTLQMMLERVTNRLETLEDTDFDSEKHHQENTESFSGTKEWHDNEADLLVATLPDDKFEKPVSPQTKSPPSSNDKEIMQRMREHVKAREPDAPMLEPGEENKPLEPGSGKPELMPLLSSQTNTGPVHRAGADNDTSAKSKTDFIAAARRAARAAASEQAELSNELKEEQSKSAFASIRERLQNVTKNRKKTETETETADIIKDNEPVVTFSEEPLMLDDNFVSSEMADAVAGEAPDGGHLRKALVASLVVAIIGSGYVFLNKPVGILITALLAEQSQGTVLKPENRTTKLANQTEETPAKAQEQPSVLPQISAPAPGTTDLPEPVSINTSTQPGASTQPEEQVSLTDITQLVNADSFASRPPLIDETITQSIRPREAVEDSATPSSTVLLALEELPANKISDKLGSAVLEGDPRAYLELARRYGEGDIFKRNLSRSAFWYEEAAALGSAIAQFRLGSIFEDGKGVAKNTNLARYWYKKAAEGGNARAMHNLAVLHAEGAFGSPNFDKAFKWFKKGADLGVKDSQFNVGILYVRGLGVSSNLVEAYKWFDVVARTGDDDAGLKRDEVADALTPDQLKEAQAIGRAFQKNPWIAEANIPAPAPGYWFDGKSLPVKTAKPAVKKGAPLVREAQILLNRLGFDTGKPDGLIGKRTRDAVRAFEYEIGKQQTGKITKALIATLKTQHPI